MFIFEIALRRLYSLNQIVFFIDDMFHLHPFTIQIFFVRFLQQNQIIGAYNYAQNVLILLESFMYPRHSEMLSKEGSLIQNKIFQLHEKTLKTRLNHGSNFFLVFGQHNSFFLIATSPALTKISEF